MNKVAVIYKNENKEQMQYLYESIKFHYNDINFSKKYNDFDTKVLITQKSTISYGKDVLFLISDINQYINTYNNILMLIYESEYIKNEILKKCPNLITFDSIVMNTLPEQKREIKPLDTQNATIFYQGKDDKYDMVDEMFQLDMETHYEIKFYSEDSKKEPSKLHKLSWCVSKNPNNIGFINYEIVKEIENGCLPILIKEYMPSYFFAYPFYVNLDDLTDKDKLIKRVKEISAFIAKMDREDFKLLANSIYNGIYVNTNWKYNNYLIANKIKVSM